MKKPNAIIQLVEELREEGAPRHTDVLPTSAAFVYPDADAEEDDKGFKLDSADCALLFGSVNAVERFVDTLPDAGEASIDLIDVTPSADVLEILERSFNAVDEG